MFNFVLRIYIFLCLYLYIYNNYQILLQNVYEFYRMQFKTSGFIILDKCFPPCAGSISAVIQLRKRIEFVINSTQFLSNV